MPIKLHLFTLFLLSFGSLILGLYIIILSGLIKAGLVPILFLFICSGLIAFLFKKLIPAQCPQCKLVKAYSSQGLGAIIYHCTSCDEITRTNFSLNSTHRHNWSTKAGHKEAQKNIAGKHYSQKKKIGRKSPFALLWDKIFKKPY